MRSSAALHHRWRHQEARLSQSQSQWQGALDSALDGKFFLLGNYSLVDTHLQGFVGWIGSMEIDLNQFPNITGWLGRCYERPALAKMMAS
ncbi:MAG: hypothetical protein RLZZ135_26 [Cyanobacteriota bacterium]|jgi:glutathione S-transferase